MTEKIIIGLDCRNDDHSKNCLNIFAKESGLDCINLGTSPTSSEKVGLIVCFGGDGTTLRHTETAAVMGVPIISVNTGNLGFLSAYSPGTMNSLYEQIRNNTVKYEEKRLLEFELDTKKHLALNDVSIQRALDEKNETAEFRLYLNDSLADRFSGDGIIISTPTGSTAYSLSTGAPVLSPDVNAFLASAICPHTMHTRPLVYPDDYDTVIKVSRSGNDCMVYYDSQLAGKIHEGGSIKIVKSDKTVRIAKVNDFFSRLNEKLRTW